MRALSQSEYGEIRSLYESIYTPQVDEELELSDEELTEAVEDAVSELIEEGYDIDDIEDAFDDELIEEILDEAKVTYGSDTENRDEVNKARRNRAKVKFGKKKIDDTKAAVKGRAKGAFDSARETAKKKTNQAKSSVASTALKVTGTKLKDKHGKDLTPQTTNTAFKSVRDKAKSAIKSNISGKLNRGVKKVTDTAKGVKAGAQIAGSIAKDEARRAGRKAKLAGGKAVTAVKNAPEKAGASIRSKLSATKKGIKSRIASGLEKVSNKAGSAAKRMSEEVETYNVVVEFLCDYGIAEDLQEAQWLMVNEIDSEDIESILEAYANAKLPLSREKKKLKK